MWRRELLKPVGANPLSEFDVIGTTQRTPTPTHGFVIKMVEGSPPTRITLPKKAAPTLNLRHRYLILEVRTDPAIPFSIEVGLKDTFMLNRMLILSNGCKAPELAKGGGAKAKLPIVAVPPTSPDGVAAGSEFVVAGWRLAVLDLDMLVRYAFDGAPYHKLESVALVGACLVRSMAASAEPPQVQPPGPVRLVPLFTAKPHPTVPVQIGQGGVGGYDVPPPPEPPFDIDPDEFLPKQQREAREAVRQASETKEAIEASKAAERDFLKQSMTRMPKPISAAVGFIPARDDREDPPPAGPSAMPARFRAAVRRVGMAGRLASAPARLPRRPGDPRDHATVVGGSSDADDASIYRREEPMQGGMVSSDTAAKRSGVAAAQELARKVRWGIAGEVADLSDVIIGDGGARLLSFVLPRARVLCELRLHRSAIGDKGAGYVCSALRIMTTLRLVDLRANGIGCAGGVALAAALEVGCVGLRTLLLGGNPLSPPAVAALISALPRNMHLARLDLERTGACQSLRPLLANGERVRLLGGFVVHERTGRRLPRADGKQPDAALEGRSSVLHGVRADIGQLVDLRGCARPPLEAACLNVGSNGVVEALLRTLAQPLCALLHLHLGGNAFGAVTRREVRDALSNGPNAAGGGPGGLHNGGLTLNLGAAGDPEAEHASEVAAAEARALAAASEAPADREIALAAAAKLWVKGRPGTLPPEPSACSGVADEASADGADDFGGATRDFFSASDDDEAELDAEVARRAELPPELTLQRSQTMSKMQNATFALNGARVSSVSRPPTNSGF